MNESQVFAAALELSDPGERAAFLDGACAGDPGLRAAVDALLRTHAADPDFLERPPASLLGTADGPAATATVGTDRMERAGAVLAGRYKLVEAVGEGGMGAVWMAQQVEPVRRLVAVKVIKAGMDSRQVLARFESERQALALMDHPNIAKVHDAGAAPDGRPFFVMELVKGVPITQYCDDHHLTPRERLELFVPVCQAIQHAHQKGVIHRDVKPSNVLVARYDDRPVPKVIDFGVAKAAGQPLTEQTLVTGIGAVVGTVEYMSPEQASFNQLDVDTRSDVYSLGVLLYELLAGSPPFTIHDLENAGVLEMLRVIREQEPTKPSAKLSTAEGLPTLAANRGTEPARLTRLVRGELDWIVMKALEKDRARRYETANAFAMDVQRYLADEAVTAGPPGAAYRVRKFVRRNKGRLAAAAAAVLAGAVMAGSIGWAVRDRVARRAQVEQAEAARLDHVAARVRGTLGAARALAEEGQPGPAREKLAQARAELGGDGPALADLAAEVAAAEAALDRFRRFLTLIDRAHQAETSARLDPAVMSDGPRGEARSAVPTTPGEHRAEVIRLFRQALEEFGVLDRDDWAQGPLVGSLARPQADQVRRLAFEELLRLAEDALDRQHEHGSERRLSPADAARQALAYLDRAERAGGPTQVFYALRARGRQALGETAAAEADANLADATPATTALDHHRRGVAALRARRLADMVQAFETALRQEPTRYWSMLRLGDGLCILGRGHADLGRAVVAFTGCILHRPEHAHAYNCRANAYARLGRYPEALADSSKAVELDPGNALVWYNRGVIHAQAGLPEKAVAAYSRAIELAPEFALAWNNRGVTHNGLGRLDRAVADLSQAIELDPTSAIFWDNRGAAHTKLGRPDKALADCTRAIELAPEYARPWYNRGAAHARLGQPDKAVADYSRSLDLDPTDPITWHNRGVAFGKLNQLEKAVADFSKAINLDPGYAPAWYNRGGAYYKLGRLDAAVAEYSKAIELDPGYVRAWGNRGVAHNRLNQPDKAVADCTRAIELDPSYALAWGNRGVAHNKLGDPAKALADLTRAVELAPNDEWAWFNRGVIHNKLGRPEDALADYTKAVELNPGYANAWANRGAVYNRLGQPGRALADLTRAVELDPAHAMAWFNRAETYDGLGRPDKAVADFTRVMALPARAPNLAAAPLLRARAHVRLGQFEQARADYRAVLKQASAPPEAQSELAWLLATCPDAGLRDPAEAVRLAGAAVGRAPRAVMHLRTLGVAHYRAGDFEAAAAALGKTTELLRGEDPAGQFFLAMAHRRLGNTDAARTAYERGVRWLDENQLALHWDARLAADLSRFRAEAEDVLQMKKKN